jgi:L,D-transpeptidase ErfK/SrfK
MNLSAFRCIDRGGGLRQNRASVPARINTLHAIRSRLATLKAAAGGLLALLALGAVTPASATRYELPEGAPPVFGEIEYHVTVYEDTFTDLARRYSLGWEEIARVNPGIDAWVPGEGKRLVIPNRRILPPGPREGIVINLPEHRLYYFPKPKKGETPYVLTYPISVGKMDWHTPLGETRIVSKEKNPNWYPPESVRKEHAARGEPLPRVVPPGPNNPLGKYKMRLGIPNGAYLIHGTNNPLAVGMAVTHGCIRMYPEDIEELFPLVPVGTKVRIINEPVKIAFVDGEVLVEVHPPVDKEGQSYEPDLEQFAALLDQALGPTTAAVHWDIAREVLQAANGIPTVVGLEADLTPEPEPLPPGVPDDSGVAAPAVASNSERQEAAADVESPAALSSEPMQPEAVEPPTVILPEPQATPPVAASAPVLPPPADAEASGPVTTSARTFPAGEPATVISESIEIETDDSPAAGTAVATGADHP